MQTVLYQNKLKHRDSLNTLKADVAIYAERKKCRVEANFQKHNEPGVHELERTPPQKLLKITLLFYGCNFTAEAEKL